MLWHSFASWVHCALLASTAALPALSVSLGTRSAAAEPPRESNGLTDVVQWDNYTLFLHDQRMFLQYVTSSPCSQARSNQRLSFSSGEFHTFRLPVPDLWLDIFQKMVATGLNAVRYV